MYDIERVRQIAHIFSFSLIGGFSIDCRDSHLYKTEFGTDIFWDSLLVDWDELITDI